MRTLINFALFQVGWFACVLAAAAGRPELGVTTVIIICVVHVLGVADDTFGELRLLVLLTVGGSAISAFNVANGAVDFAPGIASVVGVPLWLACMWALFATILRHSLGWLRGRYLLAAFAGLVGSPLSYSAAESFGAASIHPEFLRGRLVLGLTWAVAVPAALWLAERTAASPLEPVARAEVEGR